MRFSPLLGIAKPATLIAILTVYPLSTTFSFAYRLTDNDERSLLYHPQVENLMAGKTEADNIDKEKFVEALEENIAEAELLDQLGATEVKPLQRRPVRPGDSSTAQQDLSVTVNPRPSRLPPNTIVIKPSLLSFERCELFSDYLDATLIRDRRDPDGDRDNKKRPTIGRLLCEQACWTPYLCPDDCLEREQLVDYCNNVYLDLSNLLSISTVCDICTYQCRETCITYTQFCCPCKGAKDYNRYALEIEPDDYSCKEFFVRENFEFDDETPILKRGSKEWSGPDVYGGFISDTKGAAYWYSGKFKHASPGLGIGYGNGPATGEASALFLWKQDDYGNDLDVGPVRWFHTPGSSDSEDRVRYKGDNYYCSDVCDHSIDSKFRVVFQDSGGWHIAKTTKDTAKGLRSIYMADPDREYRRFDPYINDVSQIEAGYTYKDSCPTFTCLQWIGFRIDTYRKCSHKWYSGRKDDCAISVVEEFNVKAKGSHLRTEDIPRLTTLPNPQTAF